jgi:transcriptional regulator GlxA family with amidase domain
VKPPFNVAILIFDEVEVLDFCGPFEVFSVTGQQHSEPPFHVYTCAERTQHVWARNQFCVQPRHTLENCPAPDILIVPGGFGTRALLENSGVIEWIRHTAEQAQWVLSVCTGSLLLAKAGLLHGLSATTHHKAIELLKTLAPNTTVLSKRRFIDNGKIITSGGISAGIDMSLYVVGKILGEQEAEATAAYMEYDWRERKNGISKKA